MRREWSGLACSEIDSMMIEQYIKKRKKVSRIVANKEIQYLRALFKYGIDKELITYNPATKVKFYSIDEQRKYIPPKEDVSKVISFADPDTQHYLWTIVLTAGRVNEINNLTWDDVSFAKRCITLWTRKRKNGNKEPRGIPMVPKLYKILRHRFKQRKNNLPWVFWHEYWCRETRQWVKAPYKDRKKIMKTLCTKANVRYFRFHAMRHLTASVLDAMGTPIGTIQRILGHQNRKTTEIYLHSVGDAERKAMEKLQEVDAFSKVEATLLGAPVNPGRAFLSRKVERPPFDTLKSEVNELGYSAVGRKYGVSDNAVRKWLKAYLKNKH